MAKQLFYRVKNNHLIKSSAVFFIGSMIASLGSYLFHLFMGRMLSVVEYGELQSLISIFTIIYLPTVSLTLVVTKYSSSHSAPGELIKIKTLLKFLSEKFIYIGVAIFAVLVLLSGRLADYLRIKESAKVIIISAVFIFIFLTSINKGALQGLQKFKNLSLILILETFGKLFFGIILVLIGWRVYGAIGGFVLGVIIGYLYSFYPLKKILKFKSHGIFKREELKELNKYALPVFFSLLGITLFMSLDVILAKHYFTPEAAGMYGGIAILGRIIFYATAPMVSVLFSISAKQHKDGDNYHKSLFLSCIIISAIGFAAIFSYFVLPELIISTLLGNKYLFIVPYLGWYALAMTLLSLINLIVNFFLSIKMTKCVYWVLGGVITQFICIIIWHNNIEQFMWIMNVIMLIILFGLSYYYFNFRGNFSVL